jgi:fluoride exporter
MSATVLWVALAGGLGALVRYGVTRALPRRDASSFPTAVLLVNIVGSFVAGVTLGLFLLDMISFDVSVVIWAGLCGAMTTFSTFAVDTVLLATSRRKSAWANIILTIGLSIASGSVGLALAHAVALIR